MKKCASSKGKTHYQNLRDKYLAAAKEAFSSGDIVLNEHNLQYAEHYKRILLENFENNDFPDDQIDQTVQVVESKEEMKPKKRQCIRKPIQIKRNPS